MQQAIKRRPKFADAQFLNIDLDVRSRRSLTALVEAWPWSYQPLDVKSRPNPRWLILHPRRVSVTAEAAAKELLQHIRGLRGSARLCSTHAYPTHVRYRRASKRGGAGLPGNLPTDPDAPPRPFLSPPNPTP